MQTLLIGTNNPSKLEITRSYLAPYDVQVVSPRSLGLDDIPAEGARTAIGNAIEKAKAWHAVSGLPVITEDSGLVFLDLPLDHPDQPGVHVRRAAGHVMTDDEMLAWYQAIIHRHGGQLRAAWADAWCLLSSPDCYWTYEDPFEKLELHARTMIDQPCDKRLPGWPLDSLTYFPQLGKYKAEMTIEEMGQVVTQTDRQAFISWLHHSVNEMLKAAE